MDLGQAKRLADMALVLSEQPDVASTLDQIMAQARLTIACDAVGVLLVREGGRRIATASVTDQPVTRAGVLQLDGQAGPCYDGLEVLESLVIDDTSRDRRWPGWSAGVARLGWRSVLSLRLFLPDRTLGALNLYASSESAFSSDDHAVGKLAGAHASIAVAGAQQRASLRTAVLARHLIGQAQGMLMERYRMDAGRSFKVLQRYSQDKNVKLRDVAEQVIGRDWHPE
jgi:GAF domain-containing protein